MSIVTHMTIMSVDTCVMNVRNQSCQSSVTSYCPFSDWWSNQFVPSISRLFVSILLTILQQIPILLLWIDGHQSMGVETLYSCWFVLFTSSQYRDTHFLAWSSTSYDHEEMSASGFPTQSSFSFAPAEILDSNMFRQPSTISSLVAHCLWVQPKWTWSRKDVGSPTSTSFIGSFHIGSMFCFFPASFMSCTYTDKNGFLGLQVSIPNLELFPNRVSIDLSQNYLSHNSPARGWPYRFRSRGTTGSSMLDHDLGHLCFGRRLQISGHSDSGTFSNVGASSILTCVSPLLVLRILVALLWHPLLLRPSFVTQMNLALWTLRKSLNNP